MGAKGDLGIELDLDKVPCRETGMSAYEMMLSESQERMLMVLRPEKEAEAEAIFRKWELDFAIVGHTTDDLRFRVLHRGQVEANLPIKDLGDQAPEYDRPYTPAQRSTAARRRSASRAEGLRRGPASHSRLAGHVLAPLRLGAVRPPDPGQHRRAPGRRRRRHPRRRVPAKGLAFSLDVTPRYCAADPFEGGKQAVAECWRNLTASGAEPLAVTDNLNFGNPEKPEIMGELVGCIKGISEACEALRFPVVSGNVSLYNETNGAAIPPTPTIGGVGLMPDVAACRHDCLQGGRRGDPACRRA